MIACYGSVECGDGDAVRAILAAWVGSALAAKETRVGTEITHEREGFSLYAFRAGPGFLLQGNAAAPAGDVHAALQRLLALCRAAGVAARFEYVTIDDETAAQIGEDTYVE